MRKLFAAFPLALAMLSGGSGAAPAGQPAGSAYDFAFQAIDGGPLPLDGYRGKVVRSSTPPLNAASPVSTKASRRFGIAIRTEGLSS